MRNTIALLFLFCCCTKLSATQSPTDDQLAIWTFPTVNTNSGDIIESTQEDVVGIPTLMMFNENIDPNGKAGISYVDIDTTAHAENDAIAWNDIAQGNSLDAELQININTTDWQDLKLRFDYKSEETESVDLAYSLDNGTTFQNIQNNISLVADGNVDWQLFFIDMSNISAIEDAGAVIFRFSNFAQSTDTGNAEKFRIDNLEIYGISQNACPMPIDLSFDDGNTITYVELGSDGGFLSGVINDPTDPAGTYGIAFSCNDATATYSAIAAPTGIVTTSVVQSGANARLYIAPIGVGYTTITLRVKDGVNCGEDTYVINYAASAATTATSSSFFHVSTSDASSAVALNADEMLVADDENETLRLFNRHHSGLPVASFYVRWFLGLTGSGEVDIEASAKIDNQIFWISSHGNSGSGNEQPNRQRIFATTISGTGTNTALTFNGYYQYLRDDLISWDDANGGVLGLSDSAEPPNIPKAVDGFNIEGLVMAPGSSTTAYVCFRAPIVSPGSRTDALIVPVLNFTGLLGMSAGSAVFGDPIFLDLGGRGFRSVDKNAADQYLILAGPPGEATGIAPLDFALYTWTGQANDAPLLTETDLSIPFYETGGSFESIIEVPDNLAIGDTIHLLLDNGTADWYNDGMENKDLTEPHYQKCQQYRVVLGNVEGSCNAVLNYGNISMQSGLYIAANQITTESIVPQGTTVNFQAGNMIELQSGFMVLPEAEFSAYIQSCQ